MRLTIFSDILSTGDRKEIAKVINTLLKKKIEVELYEKKLNEQDRKLLIYSQNILFKELAISLNCSYEDINDMIIR
ncbi:CarD family transcriptional regulator, partial [Neobacillus drentensis]